MIKFTVKNSSVVGLGLSEENIKLLKQGKPILVKGDDIGIINDIFIFYGKTESDMAKELKEYMTGDTIIRGED